MKEGPSGFGDRELIPSDPKLLAARNRSGERCGNVGMLIRAGTVERGERKSTSANSAIPIGFRPLPRGS